MVPQRKVEEESADCSNGT
ncbi:hypothetical protein TNIN_74411, partial [Trichonephila inaurata madagascariensis]